MEDFEPQDFETFDQTVERLLGIERQLAARFGLTGNIRAQLIEMDKANKLIEDALVADWHCAYATYDSELRHMMICIPTQGDPAELAAQLAAHLQGGPLPPGYIYKPLEEIYAEGRIDDCTCGLISCVCKVVRVHKQDCRFRISLVCPVGIACEHGSELCPICDACTCQGDHAEVRP